MNFETNLETPRARVLFSTGSLYLLDVSYCFALAKEAGYDGIEIMCDDRWSTRDPRYLSDLAAANDLPIRVIHTPFSSKIPGWGNAADDVNRIEHTLELAEAVGAETMVVHLPPKLGSKTLVVGGLEIRIPAALTQHKVKDWIETRLTEVQNKTPIRIALENMPRRDVVGFTGDPTWWNEIESWCTLHRYLTLDTTHWATKGIDPLDAYTAARDRVAHVHLSNYYNGEEHHLPHKGVIKLGRLLEHMAADGYAGTISLEVSPQNLEYKDPKSMRRKMKDAARFIRTHIGQIDPAAAVDESAGG